MQCTVAICSWCALFFAWSSTICCFHGALKSIVLSAPVNHDKLVKERSMYGCMATAPAFFYVYEGVYFLWVYQPQQMRSSDRRNVPSSLPIALCFIEHFMDFLGFVAGAGEKKSIIKDKTVQTNHCSRQRLPANHPYFIIYC